MQMLTSGRRPRANSRGTLYGLIGARARRCALVNTRPGISRCRLSAWQSTARGRIATGVHMSASDGGLLGEVKDACPHCHQPCGTPTLLTSMVRYYTCAGCGHSWRVLRELHVER